MEKNFKVTPWPWTLIGQCPMSSYFHILQYVQVSSGLNHYFWVIMYTGTHTHSHRQKDRQTHRQGFSQYRTQETAKQTAKLAPSVKLNIIFSASNKLSKLCKLKCTLPIVKQSNVIYNSRGQDVIPWNLLAEIDFFVLSYPLTLTLWKKIGCNFSCQN